MIEHLNKPQHAIYIRTQLLRKKNEFCGSWQITPLGCTSLYDVAVYVVYAAYVHTALQYLLQTLYDLH